jgi:hypothetical protein
MLKFHASLRGGLNAHDALTTTFDDALQALAKLDRLFIEPDGSFVWTGIAADGQAWQVDGNLIDRGDSLAYVELNGLCPQAEFDRLLSVFGWPPAPLAFHLPQRGILLNELEFRRLAASADGAI